MDKIFSSRIDDAVIHKIGFLARKLKTSKKAIIEAAIREYSQKVEKNNKIDILEQTCGAWQRAEKPEETVKQVKNAFRRSMERHKR